MHAFSKCAPPEPTGLSYPSRQRCNGSGYESQNKTTLLSKIASLRRGGERGWPPLRPKKHNNNNNTKQKRNKNGRARDKGGDPPNKSKNQTSQNDSGLTHPLFLGRLFFDGLLQTHLTKYHHCNEANFLYTIRNLTQHGCRVRDSPK